ncbi:MAG: hypothetical protein HY010_17510 [Acidobacteria bacterium]|nr:hypothetical protein [Acidobacteriota bacterium]
MRLGNILLLLTLALVTIAASEQSIDYSADVLAPASTKQLWQKGWDNFGEPLNLNSSNITWALSNAKKLTVTFALVGATPNKLYQVGIHIFCNTAPAGFGQFPVTSNGGNCIPLVRQGVSGSVAAVEFGVVTTDKNGKGSFKVVVGPIASGTYKFEFTARDGAGCNLIGGAGNGTDCFADFQSPGPFGTLNTMVVP